MPRYGDVLFFPAAPVAHVTLRAPNNSATVNDVPMLIDSGSDVTLLPRAFVEQLGIETDTETSYELTGFDGSKSVSPVVSVHLIFLRKTFSGTVSSYRTGMGRSGTRCFESHSPSS